MAVPHFQDLPLADRDRAWDGAAAERRVRRDDVERVKNHLARYYRKMGEDPPWDR